MSPQVVQERLQDLKSALREVATRVVVFVMGVALVSFILLLVWLGLRQPRILVLLVVAAVCVLLSYTLAAEAHRTRNSRNEAALFRKDGKAVGTVFLVMTLIVYGAMLMRQQLLHNHDVHYFTVVYASNSSNNATEHGWGGWLGLSLLCYPVVFAVAAMLLYWPEKYRFHGRLFTGLVTFLATWLVISLSVLFYRPTPEWEGVKRLDPEKLVLPSPKSKD